MPVIIPSKVLELTCLPIFRLQQGMRPGTAQARLGGVRGHPRVQVQDADPLTSSTCSTNTCGSPWFAGCAPPPSSPEAVSPERIANRRSGSTLGGGGDSGGGSCGACARGVGTAATKEYSAYVTWEDLRPPPSLPLSPHAPTEFVKGASGGAFLAASPPDHSASEAAWWLDKHGAAPAPAEALVQVAPAAEAQVARGSAPVAPLHPAGGRATSARATSARSDDKRRSPLLMRLPAAGGVPPSGLSAASSSARRPSSSPREYGRPPQRPEQSEAAGSSHITAQSAMAKGSSGITSAGSTSRPNSFAEAATKGKTATIKPSAASLAASAHTATESQAGGGGDRRVAPLSQKDFGRFSALSVAISERLGPQLQSIDDAISSSKPTAAACDGSLEVLHALAPLLGPLEPTTLQLANAAHHASRAPPRRSHEPLSDSSITTLPEHIAGMTRHYFGAAAALEQAMDQLSAERDAALSESHAQQGRLRESEVALAKTRAELEGKREAIDTTMRAVAASRTQLERVRKKQVGQDARVTELLQTNGRATRMWLQEQTRLENKMVDMQIEHNQKLQRAIELDSFVKERAVRSWASVEVAKRRVMGVSALSPRRAKRT